MRDLLRALASLRLTVVLTLVVATVLAATTIVESTRGTPAARAIYESWWFYALLAAFGLNALAALIDRWPKNRQRVGFAITHLSLVVILLGALLTALFKVEGQVALWEGESTDAMLLFDGDRPGGTHPLGFTLRLDAFEIDTYQGTRRPAMFRSKVTMIDGAGEHAGSLQMNQPLAWGGFRFFQSSYQQSGGREMSVLSVAHDPGQGLVFLGYTLLVGGMIVVFATRLAQHREAERSEATAAAAAQDEVGAMARRRRAAGSPARPGRAAARVAGALALAAGAMAAASAPGGAATLPDAATVAAVRGLPVQHDGRTMPFDTQAREAVREVTGMRAWPGIEPVAMVLGWTLDPAGWREQPIVRIDDDQAATAGLPGGTRWTSFMRLVQSSGLAEAIARARARQQAEEKLSGAEQDLLELEERLVTLHGYLEGRSLKPIPGAAANDSWTPAPVGAAELAGLERDLRATPAAHYPSAAAMARELRYNAWRPTRIAWWLLVPAAVASAFTIGRGRAGLAMIANILMVAGFLVMTWGLATRWQIAGRIPAANMYESMLFLGWGTGLLGVIALLLRNRLMLVNAAATSALAMGLLDLLPIDPFIHPVPPVLAGTPWLAIHVPIIMLGYAGLAIVTVFAHLVVGVEIFAPSRRDLSERFSQLLYWYTHVGSILLLAGILTGSIWAASSWGRYWGWDPKEVWSLVAFLAYMAILHARFDRQIHAFGVAVASIGAFWTILMTYLGVNFVLASGLHSYGFGGSGVVDGMALVALVEVAFVAVGWAAHRRRLRADEALATAGA